MDVLKKMKTFDAYPKTLEDFRVRTTSGAVVSIVSAIFMLWLFLSEFSAFLQTDVRPELFVDTTRGEKLRINFDIAFPHMACAFLSVDAMDASGEHQLGVEHNIIKTRLALDGSVIQSEKHNLNAPKPNKTAAIDPNYCGDCYGGDPPQGSSCCNTCEDVQESYRRKGWAFHPDSVEQCIREGFTQKLKEQQNEGCRVSGYLFVNKVLGNFHIAPGKSYQAEHSHVHDIDMLRFGGGTFNLTHKIHRLSFGEDFPGIKNPLDGVDKPWTEKTSAMFQYFIKIVPTIYEDVYGNVISTNQFSVTEHQRAMAAGSHSGLPGLFISYELSPIMVKFTEYTQSLPHFLTSMCAIIGGIFTIAGLVDSFIYHGMKSLKKKMELGKDT